MVDRIVPATKPEDIERLAALTGRLDLSPVMHEPFRQWVVEDDFVDGARPDLGAVGVQLVEDVTPFELMKLRMLNGTHSSLAYLGYLAGHETIADTVADPAFAALRPPPLARRDHPDARAAAGRGPRRLCRRAARALRQPGDPPPHLADRHGRLAEAAAAHPRHHRRQPRRRPPLPRPRPRRRRLDALRRRHRRAAAAPIDVRDPLAAAPEGARPTRRRDPDGPGRGAPRRGRGLPARARRRRGLPRRPSPPPMLASLADGARAAVARVAGDKPRRRARYDAGPAPEGRAMLDAATPARSSAPPTTSRS